jgi:hypothetical protein
LWTPVIPVLRRLRQKDHRFEVRSTWATEQESVFKKKTGREGGREGGMKGRERGKGREGREGKEKKGKEERRERIKEWFNTQCDI